MLTNIRNKIALLISDFIREIKTNPSVKKFLIITKEISATITFIVPSTVKWVFKRHISKQIACTPIDHPGFRRAYLFRHRGSTVPSNKPALLFLHGNPGHPMTMLHFVESIAKEYQTEIFLLGLPYNNQNPASHNFLFTKALDEIKSFCEKNSQVFNGVIAIGHSRGAIEACYQAFVANEDRIKAIISIAGRLRICDSHDKQCHPSLKPVIHTIYENILKHDHIPLYQIVAEDDWNAPLKETRVRSMTSHVIEKAHHLNILFYNETLRKFHEIIKLTTDP